MNLGEIRQEIADALKHGSDVQASKDWRTRRVNSVYLELLHSHQWTFLERQTGPTTIYADIDLADVDFSNGSYVVSVNGSPAPASHWQGHLLLAPDGDEYEIGFISGSDLHLTQAYNGPTALTQKAHVAFYDWSLQTNGVPIGRVLDVIERYDVGSTDVDLLDHGKGRGKLIYVSHEREAGLNLNLTDTGQPTHYLLRSQEPQRAPAAPTATLVAGGTLTSGTAYHYFVVYFDGNRWSHRSAIVSATPTGATLSVQLSGVGTGDPDTGRKERIYRATGTSRVFELLKERNGDSGNYTDDGTDTPQPSQRWRDLEPGLWLQFWPRPSSDMNVTIRYQLNAPRLLADTDVPVLPEPYHRIIVHRVVEQIAAASEGTALAKFHGEQNKALTRRLKSAALSRPSDTPQRGMWGEGSAVVVQPDINLRGGL